MADELFRAVGQLEGRFDALEDMLKDQNANRQAMHEENKAEMKGLRLAMDGTAAMTAQNTQWIEGIGKPLVLDVEALKAAGAAEKNRARGAAAVWIVLGSIGTAAIAVITAVATLGKDGIEAILRAFHHG